MQGGPSASPPSRPGAATGGPFAAVSASRSILGEAGPHVPQGGPLMTAAAGGSMGPLSMQYGSTMQQAKKSAHAAGLAAAAGGGISPQEQRGVPAGWVGPAPQQPGAGAEAGMDAAGANNKYASSWGILDAGGMSRQSSMNGGGGGGTGGQLSRMPSGSVRASPRISTADPADPHTTAGWQQQQRLRGAAGRYAGASFTPGSQSPRSGTATPVREDSSAMAAAGGAHASPARRRVAAGAAAGGGSGRGEQGRRGSAAGGGGVGGLQGREGSNAGSDDYESAEEQLSSGASGLSVPYGSSTGGAPPPPPPAFLSGRPTSAQAAVATQWSPSKNAAAFAQAPAYMRDAVMSILREPSGPQGLQVNTTNISRGVSPRDGSNPPLSAGSGAAAAAGGPGRVSSSSIGGRMSQASGYEPGGYNIYAPLGPPAARTSSGHQMYQQQQQVVTAVDLARRQSQMMHASSSGAAHQGAYEYGHPGGGGAGGGAGAGALSSHGRMSSSSMGQQYMGQYTQSSFQGGGGAGGGGGMYGSSAGGYTTVGTFPGSGRQQQQQQPNIYSALKAPMQRQQYRF